MVLVVKPANANRMFRALADPTRRAVFEHLARRRRNESRNLTKPRNAEQTQLKAERTSHANQTHKRLRGRSRQGAEVLHRRSGLPKENGFPWGREIQVAHSGLPRRTGRRATGP